MGKCLPEMMGLMNRKNWHPGRWFLGKNGKIEEGRWTGKEVDLWYYCDEGDDQWTDITEEMIHALETSRTAAKRKKATDGVASFFPDTGSGIPVSPTRTGTQGMGRGRAEGATERRAR